MDRVAINAWQKQSRSVANNYQNEDWQIVNKHLAETDLGPCFFDKNKQWQA
jgi:hypothetical protein